MEEDRDRWPGKFLDKSSRGLFESSIPAFKYRNWRKPRKCGLYPASRTAYERCASQIPGATGKYVANTFLFNWLYWRRKVFAYTANNGLLCHTVTRTVLPQHDAHKVYMSCFYENLTLYFYFPIDLRKNLECHRYTLLLGRYGQKQLTADLFRTSRLNTWLFNVRYAADHHHCFLFVSGWDWSEQCRSKMKCEENKDDFCLQQIPVSLKRFTSRRTLTKHTKT
jgi:hypothetical protein